MNEWQPIKTAPVDGTEIWAYAAEQARMKFLDTPDGGLWVWAEEVLQDIDPCPEQPTHWMPLPPPPLAIAQQDCWHDAAQKRIEQLDAECSTLRAALSEARADERQAMAYLEACRQAISPGEDFPTMVGIIQGMAEMTHRRADSQATSPSAGANTVVDTQRLPLSQRVRPNVEVAPWVLEEIRALDALVVENSELRQAFHHACEELHAIKQALTPAGQEPPIGTMFSMIEQLKREAGRL